MPATTTRRMTIEERRDFLARLKDEGWLGATLDDTPRFVARKGRAVGWGYDRAAAIADLKEEENGTHHQ